MRLLKFGVVSSPWIEFCQFYVILTGERWSVNSRLIANQTAAGAPKYILEHVSCWVWGWFKQTAQRPHLVNRTLQNVPLPKSLFSQYSITLTSSPSKLSKSQRSRQRRARIFSLFSPPQIQQFRGAFSFIDHGRNSVMTYQVLRHLFTGIDM